MDAERIVIAIPLLALAADVAVQVAVLRGRGRRDPWESIVLGFAGGLVVAIAGSLSVTGVPTSPDAVAVHVTNLVSFASLGYGYFAFVNLNFTSLRVRFLRELLRFDGPVSPEQLLGAYDADEALRLRLNRLIEKHQITARNGRYYVERINSFLFLAYVLDFLKWLILGRRPSRQVPT